MKIFYYFCNHKQKEMISIDDIKKKIEKELLEFNQEFDKALASENETLKLVNKHVKSMKGKQLRPIMTILGAKLCSSINKGTLHSAVALEMLHTASLVHDDVVDNSDMRRGKKSVNALFDNRVSILSGDFLLSQALNIATMAENIGIIKIITNLGKELSEGELLQMSNAKNICTEEERYLGVIKKKTAKLFSACLTCGGTSVHASEEQLKSLDAFGEKYGIIFQIRDDIFDYISTEATIGKPVGNDVREGKLTLPLIYAYNQGTEEEKKAIKDIYTKKDFTDENVKKVVDFAIQKGGIEYAEKRILDFKKESENILETFGDCEARESLQDLLEYSVQRKN